MDPLNRIESGLRDVADQLDKYSARCTKPGHLARHIGDLWVTAGCLLVEAIDLGAFPKSRVEQNRGWWDRSIGRVPGGPVAVYGTIPQALLKSASFKPQREDGAELLAVNTPDPAAVSQYPIDAAKPFTAEQHAMCWLFAFGSWLTQKFPKRFRHRAASWDWWCAKQDELGRLVDQRGKPIKGHWYRDGELLPANFKWTPDAPDGHYQWKLDAKVAGTTDFYSEDDWMEHQRIRADEHAKACRLLAELVVANAGVAIKSVEVKPSIFSPMYPRDLAAAIGCSAETLRTFATAASVDVPETGQKNFQYIGDSVEKILLHASVHAGMPTTKEKAKRMLETQCKSEEDPN